MPLCPNVTAATAAGSWSRISSKDGLVYRPHTCRLVRPTARAVRLCLKDRHLLFVGDSLQRYLYLTLANLLVRGEWPRDLPAGERSPCYEGTYLPALALNLSNAERWSYYFRGTNADLLGREICDCHRVGCCAEKVLNENRYTKLAEGGAVSFVSQMGSAHWQPHGRVLPRGWAQMRQQTSCEPGDCASPDAGWTWAAPLPTFMGEVLPQLGVTDVLLNPGHHWDPDANLPFMRQVFAAARRGTARRAWWRTTTPRLRSGVVSPTSRVGFRLGIAGATQLARQMQLGVVDVLTMLMHLNRNASFSFKEEAFIDGVHLACSVNRELLIVILNAVCDFHALGKKGYI